MTLTEIDTFKLQVFHIKKELEKRGYTLYKCTGKPYWFAVSHFGETYAIEYRTEEKTWIAARVHGSMGALAKIRFVLEKITQEVQ